MIIHLIRHTTPHVETGICYGQTDLSLADTFEQEKAIVHSKLFNQYDAIYTSPLQRCSLLAETIKAPKRYTDDRIMEYNFGDWELTPWDKLRGSAAQDWMDDFVHKSAPNGDSINTMNQRVAAFFSELYQRNYKNVAVVTHSGVQQLVHAQILETPLTNIFKLQLDFGAVMEVIVNDEKTLMTIRHL